MSRKRELTAKLKITISESSLLQNKKLQKVNPRDFDAKNTRHAKIESKGSYCNASHAMNEPKRAYRKQDPVSMRVKITMERSSTDMPQIKIQCE